MRTRFAGILNFLRSAGGAYAQIALVDTDVAFQRPLFDCLSSRAGLGARNPDDGSGLLRFKVKDESYAFDYDLKGDMRVRPDTTDLGSVVAAS